MTTTNKKKQKIKAQSYPCNRLWKPKGLWDIKDLTFSRQSAHTWC
jgi:hypothetical protein